MNLDRLCHALLMLTLVGSATHHDPLIAWLFFVNILTLATYGADKFAARKAWRRVPESTLLWLGFVGGWPAALCGQELFRHKTQKQPFRNYFLISVFLNIGVAGAIYGWYLYH